MGVQAKLNPNGSVERYKVRLVAKGFHQTPGRDFQPNGQSCNHLRSVNSGCVKKLGHQTIGSKQCFLEWHSSRSVIHGPT